MKSVLPPAQSRPHHTPMILKHSMKNKTSNRDNVHPSLLARLVINVN